MSALPDSWAECLIGDVTQIIAGGTPPSKEASNFTTGEPGIPWITPADLSGYKQVYISHGARSLTEKGFSKSSAKNMPAGSVLFSSRAPIGYVAIAANEISTNQGFKSFVLPDGINNHFIYYYLKYIKPIAEEMATGTTFKELSGAAAARIPLIVAPSKEQKRIADKLDAVLARVDACRDRLDRIPAIIKRFRQSVLAAAFTGRLTEDWRSHASVSSVLESLKTVETPPRPNRFSSRTERILDGDYGLALGNPGRTIPDGWHWIPLVDIARMESGHTPSRAHPEYWGGSVPWIGIADARDGHGKTILDTYQHTNSLGLANSAARLLPPDTVCLSRTASVGYVVKMGISMATSQDFANWSCTAVLNSDWLKYLFVAEKEAIYRFGKGSTHTTVYYPELMAFHVALPSVEEQSEIVRRVEALFACADRLEARYTTARAQVEKLTPATLAKAFRGELVPQDPNDEPASELLERIRAQRGNKLADKPRRAPALARSKSGLHQGAVE